MQQSLIRSDKPALPAVELTETARDYARESKAGNTRRAYGAQLKLWTAYAAEQGIEPFPASPASVANWLASRAASGQALSTLRTAVAAVAAGHVAKGLHFDSRAPEIRMTLSGVSRVHARVQRQAEPIRSGDIVELLAALGGNAIELRDGALLAVGYIFGLRRSELVGLDLEQHGSGDGFVKITAKTVELTLVRSKTMQGGVNEVVTIPRGAVSKAVAAIEAWIAHAGIKPGEPLLCSVEKGGRLGTRLLSQSVAHIIKSRIAEHLRRQGIPADKAALEAARFSGHSLRVGFAVSASEAGADPAGIALVTRHKSLEMPRRYAAKADALKRSPYRLPGVGTDEPSGK